MGNLPVLARLRLRKGMTQRELGNRADITVETISRIESGRRPNDITIAKLAPALEMEFDELWRLFDLEATTEEATA